MKCCVCLIDHRRLVYDGQCDEGVCITCLKNLDDKCPNCRQIFPWINPDEVDAVDEADDESDAEDEADDESISTDVSSRSNNNDWNWMGGFVKTCVSCGYRDGPCCIKWMTMYSTRPWAKQGWYCLECQYRILHGSTSPHVTHDREYFTEVVLKELIYAQHCWLIRYVSDRIIPPRSSPDPQRIQVC